MKILAGIVFSLFVFTAGCAMLTPGGTLVPTKLVPVFVPNPSAG